jgi:hypothetical protein
MAESHEIDALVCTPLTPDRWVDFESLFGGRGAYGGCWCMWWRMKRNEFESCRGEGTRQAMKSLVERSPLAGVRSPPASSSAPSTDRRCSGRLMTSRCGRLSVSTFPAAIRVAVMPTVCSGGQSTTSAARAAGCLRAIRPSRAARSSPRRRCTWGRPPSSPKRVSAKWPAHLPAG